MPLTYCPRCRHAPITDADARCPACDQDLAALRAEMARLGRPAREWYRGEKIVPIAHGRALHPRKR